jgi:hypothetical protein
MSGLNFNTLREKLEKQTWPSVYMFKFIVPANNKNLAFIESLFGENSKINIKQSSTGKYISLTATELMLSSNEVVDVYKKASVIKGIISL